MKDNYSKHNIIQETIVYGEWSLPCKPFLSNFRDCNGLGISQIGFHASPKTFYQAINQPCLSKEMLFLSMY